MTQSVHTGCASLEVELNKVLNDPWAQREGCVK